MRRPVTTDKLSRKPEKKISQGMEALAEEKAKPRFIYDFTSRPASDGRCLEVRVLALPR